MSIGKFDTQNISKQTTVMLCALIGITVALVVYSTISPPPGKLDESIFKLVPWTFAFCTLLVAREAIKEGLGVKYTHGDTRIEIDNDNDDDDSRTT